MNRKSTLYIAYGSNLNLPQMANRCPTAEVVGASQLKDYELLFRGSRRRDEAFLDRYEGYPRLYDKQMMDVELDGKPVSAMVYIMTPGHEFGIPSDYYVDTIWQGYESAGFDTQILEDAVEKAIELTRYQEQQEATEQTSLFGMGGIK